MVTAPVPMMTAAVAPVPAMIPVAARTYMMIALPVVAAPAMVVILPMPIAWRRDDIAMGPQGAVMVVWRRHAYADVDVGLGRRRRGGKSRNQAERCQ